MNRILASLTMAGMPLLAASAAAQTAPGPQHYAPGQPIQVELALMERSPEGGRSTPIFDHYRPTIAFEGGDPVRCEFFTEVSGGHKPGTTQPARLVCPADVREGQSFTAHELGRKVGSGVVVARTSP